MLYIIYFIIGILVDLFIRIKLGYTILDYQWWIALVIFLIVYVVVLHLIFTFIKPRFKK